MPLIEAVFSSLGLHLGGSRTNPERLQLENFISQIKSAVFHVPSSHKAMKDKCELWREKLSVVFM